MRQFSCALTAVAVLTTATVFGRPIQLYTYERLFKEADLVVIATATETKDTATASRGGTTSLDETPHSKSTTLSRGKPNRGALSFFTSNTSANMTSSIRLCW